MEKLSIAMKPMVITITNFTPKWSPKNTCRQSRQNRFQNSIKPYRGYESMHEHADHRGSNKS